MAETLTSNLKLELEKTQTAFNRWTEQSLDDLDSSKTLFQQQLEVFEHAMKALDSTKADLEEARSTNDKEKIRQKEEVEHYIAETERLKKTVKSWENDMNKYTTEEEHEALRLEKIRGEHDELRDRMEKKLNDLTYGIKLYEALGLKLVKMDTPGTPLKFVFTQMCEQDPSREFSFVITVNSDDQYYLEETTPALAPTICAMYVNTLNKDNHIGRFCLSMRKAFKAMM
jgi:hypothetical protein